MRIVVDIPDELDISFVKIAKGVLDSVEYGASTHCLRYPHGWMNNNVQHVRLGVTITEEPLKFAAAL